jgi:K+-transporting ATPase ATPase B chain
VLFANAAEALAEGRGKAQADALRAARKRVLRRCSTSRDVRQHRPSRRATSWRGSIVLVEAGETIPPTAK